MAQSLLLEIFLEFVVLFVQPHGERLHPAYRGWDEVSVSVVAHTDAQRATSMVDALQTIDYPLVDNNFLIFRLP